VLLSIIAFPAIPLIGIAYIVFSKESELRKQVTASPAAFAELKQFSQRYIGKSWDELRSINEEGWCLPAHLQKSTGLNYFILLEGADNTITALQFQGPGSGGMLHYGIIIGAANDPNIKKYGSFSRRIKSQWDECTWYFLD
jgi:hypothetical protein